jgi:hypothetical protein
MRSFTFMMDIKAKGCAKKKLILIHPWQDKGNGLRILEAPLILLTMA